MMPRSDTTLAIGAKSLVNGEAVLFRLRNGPPYLPDFIDPQSRRTFAHIIHTNVGTFPANGLTSKQGIIKAKSVLALSDVSQRTKSGHLSRDLTSPNVSLITYGR